MINILYKFLVNCNNMGFDMECFMSGDMGLDETIIFYSEDMTQAKLIVRKYKGIKLEYKSLKENFDKKANFPSFKTFGRENVGNIQQIKIV